MELVLKRNLFTLFQQRRLFNLSHFVKQCTSIFDANFWASAQSDLGLRSPATEPLAIVEYTNGQQRLDQPA